MRDRSKIAVRAGAIAIAIFQVVGSFGATQNQPDRKPMDWLAVLLVLAGPAALALRDRRPIGALVVAAAAADVYVGLGYAYGPIFVSVIVAAFSALHANHRRATWTVAGLGYVGFVAASFADPRRDGIGLVQLALVAGWLVVVLAVAELVRVRRSQFAERARAEREGRQRRLSEERLRLAQDLHDVLAHNISLINVQAGVALHLLDDQPEQARPALANIKRASRDALHELRAALDVLRTGEDAPRAPAPTLADLDALVSGVRASGLDVRTECVGTPAALPATVELAAYRIVQEALTNVTRHADARSATIHLTYAADLTVEVVDDGSGHAHGGRDAAGVVDGGGNGLVGMRERAVALGGTMEAGPRPGGGFRVIATLPLRRNGSDG
ncbi:MAG: two-component sensor histidine kinase [Ilumatobacteraceae bacterium]|nr:two-component sensor histidine kinase [Ilumatobacteraceae bacterium]